LFSIGSGEIHTAYFYKRASTPATLKQKPGVSIISLKGRDHVSGDAKEEQIACDNSFKESVLLAAGSSMDAAANIKTAVETLTAAGRPTRERKPRVL
jgi:hypothetical protein